MTNTLQPRDETQIIASILAGDAHLFHQLIRPYERSVYVMALSFLKNEADAEDTAQEAFLKAFRNLASFRGDSKFGTWLISITLNEARSRLRSRNNVKIESLDEPPEDGHSHVTPALLPDWRDKPPEAPEPKHATPTPPPPSPATGARYPPRPPNARRFAVSSSRPSPACP